MNRIKEVLHDKHMTQKKLAKRTHVTEVAMSRYVRGNRTPNVYMALNMADVLGVSVYDLFTTERKAAK